MHEIPLDDIHRMLDTLDRVIPAIDRRPTDSLQVAMLPELSEVVLEVLDWTNTAYVENKLGVNSALLNKFVNMRGVVRKNAARKLADRLRTYLKAEDQRSEVSESKPKPAKVKTRAAVPAKSKAFTVPAENWITVAVSSEMKAKITVIASLLDSIIEQITRANAPEDEQILTRIERQQLIAVLETALQVLKSPMVETGLLRKARDMLRRGSESAAEKGVQQGVGSMMESAGARLLDLLRLLGG